MFAAAVVVVLVIVTLSFSLWFIRKRKTLAWNLLKTLSLSLQQPYAGREKKSVERREKSEESASESDSE